MSDLRSASGAAGPRAGVFVHTGKGLGGAQMVDAQLAQALSARFAVDMVLLEGAPSVDRIRRMTGCELDTVEQRRPTYRIVPPRPSVRNLPRYLTDLLIRHRRMTSRYDLFICSTHQAPPFSAADRSILYCHFPYGPHPKMDRTPGEDLGIRADVKSRLRAWLWDLRLDSYDTVLANSEFTANWIERRWGREAHVVYPPVTAEPPDAEKTDQVISIGRFSPDKRQDELIEAFRSFHRRAPGDWRLVLAGTCHPRHKFEPYLRKLRSRAGRLPVEFEIDIERDRLLHHLARAKLYWHGKGFGRDRRPRDREHFGISTVEAMRAGCVPVVPDEGGQKEIVSDDVGWRCDSHREVVEVSLEMARRKDLRRAMAETARERSFRYSKRAFEERLRELQIPGGV